VGLGALLTLHQGPLYTGDNTLGKEIKKLKEAAQARAQNEIMARQVNEWLDNISAIARKTTTKVDACNQGQLINLRILNDMNKGCVSITDEGNIDLNWYISQHIAVSALVKTMHQLNTM
jgi:hypothetical protein